MDDFKKKFEELVSQASGTNESNKVTEFFKLMETLSDVRQKGKEPCPDDDCGELLSECCKASLTSVFGTIPLQVKCISCGKTYILRELLNK